VRAPSRTALRISRSVVPWQWQMIIVPQRPSRNSVAT
jgi:hypothetical protein